MRRQSNTPRLGLICALVALFLCVIVGGFIAVIIWLLDKPDSFPKPPRGTIEMTTLSEDSDIRIESSTDDSRVHSVKYGSGSDGGAFTVSTDPTDDPISRHLLQRAQDGVEYLDRCFPSDVSPSRIINISFDISGSIEDLMQSDNTYTATAFNRISDLLAGQVRIRPGDRVFVRFFGANKQVLPESKYTYVFDGPRVGCELDYQRASKTAFVDITADTVRGDAGTYASVRTLVRAIQNDYDDTIQRSDVFGNETRFSAHLNTLAEDTFYEDKKGSVNEVVYIFHTDGIPTDHAPILRPLTLTNGPSSVYIIGLDRRNLSDAGQGREARIRELFEPISNIIFIS